MKTERITKHKADQDFLEKYTSLHKTEKEKKMEVEMNQTTAIEVIPWGLKYAQDL